MEVLDKKYQTELQQVINDINASEEFQTFNESEEESDYLALREAFEPQLAELHRRIADENPLQLEAAERAMCTDDCQGLYLPKILGFSILRGQLDPQYKFVHPSQHFKDILLYICQTPLFEFIQKRIGQSVQIGFALSSDIWISNLVNEVTNKEVKSYLNAQKNSKYRMLEQRIHGYQLYKKQFAHDNYFTSSFPGNYGELKLLYPSLKSFLVNRIQFGLDNASLQSHINTLLQKPEFKDTDEYIDFVVLYLQFFRPEGKDKTIIQSIFNELRKEKSGFTSLYFDHLAALQHDRTTQVMPESDQYIKSLIDPSIKDDILDYYQLMEEIHGKGYLHPSTTKAVKVFYDKHAGLSSVNECARLTIFNYIYRLLSNLEVTDYETLFEISEIFIPYMQTFENAHFNQDLEQVSKEFVHRCLAQFVDKRGKEYQDIKKFMSNRFVEFGFMTEKEVIEMFKTRRKSKATV